MDLAEVKTDPRVSLLRLAHPARRHTGPMTQIRSKLCRPSRDGSISSDYPPFLELREFVTTAVLAAGQEFAPLLPTDHPRRAGGRPRFAQPGQTDAAHARQGLHRPALGRPNGPADRRCFGRGTSGSSTAASAPTAEPSSPTTRPASRGSGTCRPAGSVPQPKPDRTATSWFRLWGGTAHMGHLTSQLGEGRLLTQKSDRETRGMSVWNKPGSARSSCGTPQRAASWHS